MNRWRFTMEIGLPEGMKPHEVVAAMADAALRKDCYVGGEVPYERVQPPLYVVPDKAGGPE